jgi:anti-sigma regulatory factor (Ser/Thr protein kinase)
VAARDGETISILDARRDVRAALERLEACCRGAGFAEPALLELLIVAEEVLSNIAKYGFEPGRKPAAELCFWLSVSEAVLEFRDEGRAFDPLGQPPPDLDAPPEQRPHGGLGLPLVRALVDDARYVREGPTNVLRLVKRRAAQ